MDRKKDNKKESFLLRHSIFSIIFIYDIIIVLVTAVFYPLIPVLMSYPPGAYNVSKQLGASYDLQMVGICLFALIIGTSILLFALKGMNQWRFLSKDIPDQYEKLKKIRKKCINLPYFIFIAQIAIINIPFLVTILVVKAITHIPTIIALRVFTIIFSVFALLAVFSLVFSKRIFSQILLKSFGEELVGRRIGLKGKIFLQVIPIAIISILLTAILGYSRLIEEKGDVMYRMVQEKVAQTLILNKDIQDQTALFDVLKTVKVEGIPLTYFVIDSNKKITTTDGFEPTGYFTYYALHPMEGDRVYGDSRETQGVVQKVATKSGELTAGVKFEVSSDKTANYFVIAFLALLSIIIFVLYYFAKTTAGDISLIAESLTEIAEGEEVSSAKKITVSSNDEIADLVIAFNKIQEREKAHAIEMEEKQALLMEQERLANLGHLIAGIAHNMRTPIMSISGGIEGLKDLIKEYGESIHDENVSQEDHLEIAKEMNVWIDKMKPYCSYMSDIITAVKGQAILSSETSEEFTLDEVAKRVNILMEHELRNRNCKLKTDFKMSLDTVVKGDISVLVQVLNNLIINSSDAYEERGGDIDFEISQKDKYVEFLVRDYGTGIPEEVKHKLFKEMVTTKGSNGTGLGLYMTYSNIKARFNGKIRFESELGKGTTFFVSLPL